jgi:hypothetical protein
MRLEDLAQGQSIVGLEPTEIVSLMAEGTEQARSLYDIYLGFQELLRRAAL